MHSVAAVAVLEPLLELEDSLAALLLLVLGDVVVVEVAELLVVVVAAAVAVVVVVVEDVLELALVVLVDCKQHSVVVVDVVPDLEEVPADDIVAAVVVAGDVAAVVDTAFVAADGDYLPFLPPLRGVDSVVDTDFLLGILHFLGDAFQAVVADDAAAVGSVESHWDASVPGCTSVDRVPGDNPLAYSDAVATNPRRLVSESPPAASAHTADTPRACTAAHCRPSPTSRPAGTRPVSSAPRTLRN